jgi:hypothetical protein
MAIESRLRGTNGAAFTRVIHNTIHRLSPPAVAAP